MRNCFLGLQQGQPNFLLLSKWRDEVYLLFYQPRAYAVALATEDTEKMADSQLCMLNGISA